ncbi:hypothetical protein SEA_SLOOPYJOE_41 [Arthrobacter phage Sloopyjoe]|nr:hypothetical protein PBI_STAYER_41 [Arthrobacter phage Stayer]QFG09749.1 hypothetical protein PBI_SHIBA_40 [Arthrobacter phage Shiba]QFG10185.1 hypothetical protein PBI_EGAD_41 [Arthrobacter phage Egad]QFG12638.1 hypothetical protein PBI_MICHELLE_41 [Arthrobacter phage Michelle]QFG14411.1 hypothetical protein PBI_STARLORD_41 [Arthrobacter phage StarLord]WAB09457.1 hypothetical protein SEA_SLOOPYJOE_41 [Arthrobacter phage Sloopyjoe]WKW85759.1 hypothetical protein SEA_MRAARONIAN_41 [Arthroba
MSFPNQLGVIMFNIVKTFGILNCLMALVIGLCTMFMLVIIYAGLCFLFGF